MVPANRILIFRLFRINCETETGNAMFQMNLNNNRQHQTLAFNSLIMNNIFNLANCFNQFGAFNLRSGFRSHPFFVCVLLLSIIVQVCLTELNAFGLENLNPLQWFVCFVFALLSALIAPLTGQQQRQRAQQQLNHQNHHSHHHHHHHHQQQQHSVNVHADARKQSRPQMTKNYRQPAKTPPTTPKSRASTGAAKHSELHHRSSTNDS